MRFLVITLGALLLTNCFAAGPVKKNQVRKPAAKIAKIPPVAAPVKVPVPQPELPPLATSLQVAGITFEGVAFDSRSHRLVVADQAAGPGSQFANSAGAARALNGIAAINAGFFTPEGAPLGIVASAGKISGSWNSASSLGSGVWSENKSNRMMIARREKVGRNSASTMREMIQAGPMLVENANRISGLEAVKTSARTVVMWDGGTRWWIGCSSPCTLADLAKTLTTAQPAKWPVHHALNLDGGRSSDLWISGDIAGGPIVRRTPWNRPVRNFLVLVAR